MKLPPESLLAVIMMGGCAGKGNVVCRIEKVVFNSAAQRWHTNWTADVQSDRTCAWSVRPPADWNDRPRTGAFSLEEEEHESLIAAASSEDFRESEGIPTYVIYMDNHRAMPPPPVRKLSEKVRLANGESYRSGR